MGLQAPWTIEGSLLPVAWPTTGTIEIEDYGLQYRKGLDWALKGISLNIQEREKVRNTQILLSTHFGCRCFFGIHKYKRSVPEQDNEIPKL